MKFQQWPKRDPNKNYFLVPNEVVHIGLSYPEISIYCYLLSIEDRETYQCYPSYKTIGKALGMCENTVSKYVRSLEEKGLIRTEPTMIRSKDGRPLNGNLLYTICPIQAAVELFYERQFRQLEEDAARQRAAECLAELAHESPQNALCAPFGAEGTPYQSGVGGPIWPAFGGASRDERKSRINDGVTSAPVRGTSARSAGSCGGVCGDWKWGQNPGRDITFAVIIPESLLPQGKNRGQPPERSQYEQKREIPTLPATEEKGHPGAPVSVGREPERHRLH